MSRSAPAGKGESHGRRNSQNMNLLLVGCSIVGRLVEASPSKKA